MTTPSAFDALREFTTATCYADFRTCCLAVGDLRAAVAEHDALRDAVRGYLATEHAHASSTQAERDADVFNALPRRAEDALRALAALVRS